MLKLYEHQCINVEEWKNRTDRGVSGSNGEFDLACCMYRMEMEHPDFFGVEELHFEKTGEKFRAVLEEEHTDREGIAELVQRTVMMDDLKVCVKLHRGEEAESGDGENA